jgi:hypothetical protein
MKQESLDALYADLAVSGKPGNGNYKYVNTALIIDKLNKVFSGCWSTHVIHSEKIGDEVLVHVTVSILDEKGQSLSCHAGFGSAKQFAGVDLGNIYKSAKSKAIKDAVKNWGLGLFLEDDVSGDTDSHSFSTAPPSNSSFPSGPTTTQAPSGNAGSFPAPTSVPPSSSIPETSFAPPMTGSTPFPDSPATSNPPPVTQNTTAVEQTAPPSGMSNGLPSMQAPPPSMGSMPQATSPQAPNNHETTELTTITLVQKLAIQAKLDVTGATFEVFSTKVFTELGKDLSKLPDDIDKLTYQDAMVLASYKK